MTSHFSFPPIKRDVTAFADALHSVQLGSENVRLRWEYRPGSELFVVYNDQRDTLSRGFPVLANRAVIVKINRLFRV